MHILNNFNHILFFLGENLMKTVKIILLAGLALACGPMQAASSSGSSSSSSCSSSSDNGSTSNAIVPATQWFNIPEPTITKTPIERSALHDKSFWKGFSIPTASGLAIMGGTTLLAYANGGKAALQSGIYKNTILTEGVLGIAAARVAIEEMRRQLPLEITAQNTHKTTVKNETTSRLEAIAFLNKNNIESNTVLIDTLDNVTKQHDSYISNNIKVSIAVPSKPSFSIEIPNKFITIDRKLKERISRRITNNKLILRTLLDQCNQLHAKICNNSEIEASFNDLIEDMKITKELPKSLKDCLGEDGKPNLELYRKRHIERGPKDRTTSHETLKLIDEKGSPEQALQAVETEISNIQTELLNTVKEYCEAPLNATIAAITEKLTPATQTAPTENRVNYCRGISWGCGLAAIAAAATTAWIWFGK